MSPETGIEELLQTLAPKVLGVLARRNHDFGLCEDAVQEALLAAALQWQADGVPANPHGWLLTVASRRLVDFLRSEQARRRREVTATTQLPTAARAADEESPADQDDTLALLYLCCHPALTPASQIALTLRAIGGLSTAAIARAFLVPEATMAPRISRAKQRIRAAGARFELPPEAERPERLQVVLHVLYLIFNEGYTTSSGPELHRVDLTREALRLTRLVHRQMPDDGEIAGLLALMLLTEARRPARTSSDGALIPLAEQDRTRWDTAAIAEGTAILTEAMSRSSLGPYQLQAAIAAVHAEAPSAEDTDWAEIALLYKILERHAPNPMVTLNRAVALAMSQGPQAGLALLADLVKDERIVKHHRFHAIRGHLLEMAGDKAGAHDEYVLASRRTASVPEQQYLLAKADRLRS